MPDDSRLAGRVAAITGASTGIGAGVAGLFLAQGAAIALMARRAERPAGHARAPRCGDQPSRLDALR